MNRLAEPVNLGFHQRDAGLKLQLRLGQRKTLAIDIDIVAVGPSVSPATSVTRGRPACESSLRAGK